LIRLALVSLEVSILGYHALHRTTQVSQRRSNVELTDDWRIGYTGDSLPLKIIIAFLLGLALYNAIELIVLAFVTFQRYRGLYFWSLVVSAFGIIPYSLGFITKFFRLLDPNENVGYVAVVLLTLGWWSMVSGTFRHTTVEGRKDVTHS